MKCLLFQIQIVYFRLRDGAEDWDGDGGVDYILSRRRTGLSPQADDESRHTKVFFFQHDQIFAKVSFTQPKTYILFSL